jgi:hypothetical protein
MMKKLSIIFVLLVMAVGVSLAQVLQFKRHAFTGKFNKSKITVSIWFEENRDGDLSGEIIYTSSKKKTPIRVFGTVNELPQNQLRYSLSEYQADGSISGFFSITHDTDSGKFSGEWHDMGFGDQQRTYTMNLNLSSFPQGKGGSFHPCSDAHGYFCYDRPHEFKEHQGGAVEISRVRGNVDKRNVDISKYDPQIAEYHGAMIFKNGRAADGLDDCGYTFMIQVYRDFVRVRTTSGLDHSYDCFGAFTTLDGFYLKTND